MRKLFFLIIFTIASLFTFAQHEGDKVIITTKDGKTTEYNLYGDNNAISSFEFGDNKLGIVLKGLEDFGVWDSFNVEDIMSVVCSVYHESDVSDVTLADEYATDATKRLYKYLKVCYGKKTFSSVIADVNWNHKIADQIYTKTGKYPAFNCYDFIHIYVPDNNGWINYNNITPVTEWADAGGLVSLMWHFNVPKTETTTVTSSGGGVTCTPSETTFKASNALVSGTWENKWFYDQMDKVVNVLLKLQEKGITATWRPFHEGAGNATLKSGASWGKSWFWWGYDGADTYKSLWKTMFNYFQAKGVHNLIWVWTTQNYNGDATSYNNDADWYPGDEYVDIVGRDLYGYSAAQNVQEYNEIKARYPNKIVTLAECGVSTNATFGNISDIWNAGAKWSYFMPWYGSSMPSDAWLKDAMSQDFVITRDQVNINTTYVEESAVDAVKNMGLGFCLGNTFDAYDVSIKNNQSNINVYEKCWGQQPVTKAQIDFLRDNGIGAVRLPVTWFQHIDADGNIDEAMMTRVQEVVDWIINDGMYCILNVHHDTGSGTEATQWIHADADNYAKNKAKFENIWKQIATRFQDYGSSLLFEGYNEMLDKNNQWDHPVSTTSYEAINNYAKSFVTTVRATGGNNTTRNLIVNTYAAANNQAVLSNLSLPEGAGHIAVEVHSYDPYDWINQYKAWNTTCSNTIKDMMTRLNTTFVSKGIPCIVGEYGTHGNNASVTSSSTESLKQAAADQAADMVKQAKNLGISTFYWMSIFDGKDRNVPQWSLPTVVEAMKKAYNE